MQRPIHSGRTYIALYRDGLIGTVEDMSRLVFPKQDSKRIQFLDAVNKKRDDQKQGDVMREIAAQWSKFDEKEKAKFEDLSNKDKQRYKT